VCVVNLEREVSVASELVKGALDGVEGLEREVSVASELVKGFLDAP
jgi:hypothetical protein